MEVWRIKIEPWRVCIPVFADSHAGCNYVLNATGGSKVTVSSVIDHLSHMRLKLVSHTSTKRVIDPLPPDESMQDGAWPPPPHPPNPPHPPPPPRTAGLSGMRVYQGWQGGGGIHGQAAAPHVYWPDTTWYIYSFSWHLAFRAGQQGQDTLSADLAIRYCCFLWIQIGPGH